jgi:tRNA dimethylallyltransferase
MKQDKYLVIIGGPTAIGKTSTAISLANKLQCEIISADSRQFYREMSIGTAKPSPDELAQAKHHFIDSLSIQDEYSVGEFETDTLSLLETIFAKQDYCILTGGSGLYLSAICSGLDKFPEVDSSFRLVLNKEFENHGLVRLVRELEEKDPDYHAKVDLSNPQRVIRALEVIRSSNQAFSSFLRQSAVERPFHILPFQLTMDRAILYDRINQRVDLMITQGLEKEARNLFPQRHFNALRTVGYSEWFDHFEGHITADKAIELIKRNTRRYAKRQITWFRNQGAYEPILQEEAAISNILRQIPKI